MEFSLGGIFAGWNFRGWNFRGWNFRWVEFSWVEFSLGGIFVGGIFVGGIFVGWIFLEPREQPFHVFWGMNNESEISLWWSASRNPCFNYFFWFLIENDNGESGKNRKSNSSKTIARKLSKIGEIAKNLIL